jgi:DDE superfamily endonuclease
MECAELSEEDVEKIGSELSQFTALFHGAFGRKEPKQLFELHMQGLLSDAERKNMEAIALRLDGPDQVRNLQRFMSDGEWDEPWMRTRHLKIAGSKTGTDGEGRSDTRLVSNSRRIVLETNDWNVSYTLSLAGITPVPNTFTVKWKAEPRFVDEFVSPGATNPAIETTVTLAQGLPNSRHTLEISGSELTPIAALRIYRPPVQHNGKE